MEEKPRQFSMARLLVSMTVLCIAAALCAASKCPSENTKPELFIASTIVFSAGIGTLVERPLAFAVVPIVFWTVCTLLALFLFLALKT